MSKLAISHSYFHSLFLHVHSHLQLEMLDQGGVYLEPVFFQRSKAMWRDCDFARFDLARLMLEGGFDQFISYQHRLTPTYLKRARLRA